jgi:hypothetical protein
MLPTDNDGAYFWTPHKGCFRECIWRRVPEIAFSVSSARSAFVQPSETDLPSISAQRTPGRRVVGRADLRGGPLQKRAAALPALPSESRSAVLPRLKLSPVDNESPTSRCCLRPPGLLRRPTLWSPSGQANAGQQCRQSRSPRWPGQPASLDPSSPPRCSPRACRRACRCIARGTR